MTMRTVLPPTFAVSSAMTSVTQQGMISPGDQYVDPATGMLMPVSFRFLFGLFDAIAQLQQQVATLQRNAGIT